MPHFTSVTLLIIMLSNAFSFFHGLDGNKHNWEVVQKCLTTVIITNLFNVVICFYYSLKLNDKNPDSEAYVRDKLIHWHEAFITFAMFSIAQAEARYFDAVQVLEKTNAEYGSRYPKRFKRFSIKHESEEEKSDLDGDKGKQKSYN